MIGGVAVAIADPRRPGDGPMTVTAQAFLQGAAACWIVCFSAAGGLPPPWTALIMSPIWASLSA